MHCHVANPAAMSPVRFITADMHCLCTLQYVQEWQPPSGDLKALIEAQWKTLDNFTTTFSAQTAAVQVG